MKFNLHNNPPKIKMSTTTALPEFVEGAEGVFFDMPDPDYRKSPGVSNSMLKNIAEDGDEPGSPAHFLASFLDPKTDTDAMFFGRMVHSQISTPGEPLPGVVATPETYTNEKGEVKPWFGGAKVCKAWIEKQESSGLRPMKRFEIENMQGVVNAVLSNPTAQVAFQKGKGEVSLFKRYNRAGGVVLRKARLDWVPPGPALVDIKTCQDARKIEFDSVIWKRRYYVQAAYYLDLWNELNPDDQKTNFVFIAVEKFAPYGVKIFDLDERDLADGRREYQRNLALVMECMKTGEWPGYSPDIEQIKMRVPYNRIMHGEP